METVEFTVYPRLKGAVVLITGASAGIGKATALQFAACGASVIITARREEKLKELQTHIQRTYGVKVHVGTLDVQSLEDIDRFFATLPEEFKAIDVVVNNAGLALERASLWEYDMKDVCTMLDTNIKGLVAVTKKVVPGMIERKRGHVINVGSVAGKEAYFGGGVYCGSKAAVLMINDALRVELVGTPLRVTLISPGLVETEFSLVRFKGDAEKAAAPYKGITPLHPEDISDAIVYAASRPEHVQVGDITVWATNQGNCTTIYRGN